MRRFDNELMVDGDLFAAHDNAVLPRRCVKTNTRKNLEQVTKQIKWVDLEYHGVGAMLKCSLTYYISSGAKQKQMMFALLGWGLIAMGFLFIVIGRGLNPDRSLPGWSAIGLLIGLVVGCLILVKFGGLFSVKKYENGVFWVKGASRAFLYDHSVE